MNYITNTTDPQVISITTRADFENQTNTPVTAILVPENNEDVSLTLSSSLTAAGYYSSLTINTSSEALDLSPETMYVLTVVDGNNNTIYNGKVFSSEQITTDYTVYNNEFTQTTSDPANDFIIFE